MDGWMDGLDTHDTGLRPVSIVSIIGALGPWLTRCHVTNFYKSTLAHSGADFE